MNDQDRFRTVNRDRDDNVFNYESPQFDRVRKRRPSVFLMIVAIVLVTVLLVSAVYSFFVSPADEFKVRGAIAQNYTIEIIEKYHAYKASSIIKVDGNAIHIETYNGKDFYYETDGEDVYIYEKTFGEWDRYKMRGDYDDMEEDSVPSFDFDALLDSNNYRPQILNPFSWHMKGDGSIGHLNDIKIRRVFGNIVITANSGDYEYKIKFKNIGFTKVELPEIEEYLED